MACYRERRALILLLLGSFCLFAANGVPIVVPYPGAARLTPYWAIGEDKIDWRKDGADAERCTVAFAATELQKYLSLTFPKSKFEYRETLPANGPAIVLGPAGTVERALHLSAVAPALSDRQAYVIQSRRHGAGSLLLLSGGGREGTLYAAYAYLQELGWRWYTPGQRGEVAPERTPELRLDGWNQREMPDFPLFRGFHAAPPSLESGPLFLWMARNRLNLWAYRPTSYALMKKLGFRFMTGGHILEQVLDPNRPEPSGKTLFEEHPDWFAEVNGKRELKNAHSYQFCVSNDAAVRFVARDIIEHLKTDWQWTDFQNVWLFDTWAGWCQCSRCRALGNDADRYLHFLAGVRRAVEQAVASGELKHDTGLDLNAYEGTPSLEPPTHPVPEILTSGKDFVLYAPINRCYAHTLADPRCTEMNTHYASTVEGWGQISSRLPLVVVEYYNVSKFEDLPLLFSRTMGPDLAYYHRAGVTGMSYMHVPISLWGPRTLTQNLYARLCWNSHAPVEQIRSEYFDRYYGPAAGTMRAFYDELETAYANITAWRSWLRTSVNHALLNWNGKRPDRPLFTMKHLQPEGGEAIGPRESLALLAKANSALQAALRMDVPSPVRLRLEEDARQFRYGADSFHFYAALAKLYEADRRGDEASARAAWTEAKGYADSLVATYVPFAYEDYTAGFTAKDGLERTQLRELYEKLKKGYEKGR